MALTPASWRVFRRRYLVALPSALLIMGTAIVGLNLKVGSTLDSVPKIGGLTFPDGPAEGGNYLIIGSDSRAFVENATQEQAFGSKAKESGQRADVMMVLHIDPTQKTNLLVSFPRDLLVEIPGRGRDLINAAFNDGPQQVINVMKSDFDISVNHYVQVNFQAFIGVVDAVGKIPVYFDGPARDAYSGLSIGFAGCTQLDGNNALAYVRARHLQIQDPQTKQWTDASRRGDLDRISRQQDFIRELAAKASAKAGQNPLAAIDIANAVVPKLTVDQQLGTDDILRLVKTFRNVDPAQPGALEMVTLPVIPSPSNANRLVAKQPEADQLLARLRAFGEAPAAPAKVQPADVTVRVLNGNNKLNGEAGRTLAAFQERAFGPAATSPIGNVSATATTQVRYAPNALAKAQLVARYLGGVGVLIEDPGLAGADVGVVIGADWRGVHSQGKPAKPPATSSTTAAKGSGSKSTNGSGSKPVAPGVPAC